MRLGGIRYLIRQGWHNMAANRLMSFASIGVLTACLIITGIASLLWMNVNAVVDYLADQNEIIVFVKPDVADDAMPAMQKQIEDLPNVLEVEYISKDAAFAQMSEWLAEYGNLLDGYENIFPAKFHVTVEDLNFLADTSTQLSSLEGVESISAPTDLAGVLITVKNAVTYGGLALVSILVLVSVIVISNTIRLTVFARRREISIMKYVGATNAFIRLPFFVEGMTVGLIAGLLASGAVCGAYYLVYQYMLESYNTWVLSLINNLLVLGDIWYWIILAFAGFGIVIGGFGTATSIRKHLKV